MSDAPGETDDKPPSSVGHVLRPRTAKPRPRRITTRSYGPGEAPDPRATYFDETGGLRQALLWATATRRQLDRWEAVAAEWLRCELYERVPPAGEVVWEAEAERHLTFVAARNLLKAIEVIQLPIQVDLVLAETVKSVRDVLEHWDENMPVFNVWPHTAQPPRKSGQSFAQRNPNLTPYSQIAWSSGDGPSLAPGLPSSALHKLLDDVEREVTAQSADLAEYIPSRPPSPWQVDDFGAYRWWPTSPGSDVVP